MNAELNKNQYEVTADYLLHLADNALILGHRNSELCGHGPILEQDIAISNIALDLLGQARNFYQYAAGKLGAGVTEDSLAYLRDPDEFRNFIMLELVNGDWAFVTARLFLFSNWQLVLYDQLRDSRDPQLAAIAAKSLKEVVYHVRWSSEWMIRLGDGTEESHSRLSRALTALWPYTFEFFECGPVEENVQSGKLRDAWMSGIREVLGEAGIDIPDLKPASANGRLGQHNPDLAELLSDMQLLQRTYPGAEW